MKKIIVAVLVSLAAPFVSAGTTNTVTKWVSPVKIGNSSISDTGTNVTVSTQVTVNGQLTVSGADVSISTSGRGIIFPDSTKQTTAATSGIGGGGTANAFAKFTGAASIGNALLTDDGTNVSQSSGAFRAVSGLSGGYSWTAAPTSLLFLNGSDPTIRSQGTNIATFNGGFGSLDIANNKFLRLTAGAVGAQGIIWTAGNSEISGDGTNLNLSGDGAKNNLSITSVGHTEYQANLSSATTCGTSPNLVGNDNVGIITTGTGNPTACTLTFANTWTNIPSCMAMDNSSTILVDVSTASTSAVTFTLSGILNGGKIFYQCASFQ